jgi:hypothetical protein
MKRVFHFAIVAVLATEALIIGQGSEAARVLNEMRAALGGDKLSGVTSITATGRSARTMGQFQMTGDVEILCELPDKYLKKETLTIGTMGSMTTALGFNGETLLQESSAPGGQQMVHGGGMVIMRGGPGGTVSGGPGGAAPSPEQQEAMKAIALRNAKTEFTRLTVALLGASYSGNPVTFVHAGQAESPEGKADILEVKGGHDFAAKLYVDMATHRPLMMSWQAPGPQVITSASGSGGATVFVGGRGGSVAGGTATQGVPPPSDERMKELMEAAKKPVEHRLYLSDYREVDGVKLPFTLIRSVDGTTTEELTLEKVKLNAKIDAKKFK